MKSMRKYFQWVMKSEITSSEFIHYILYIFKNRLYDNTFTSNFTSKLTTAAGFGFFVWQKTPSKAYDSALQLLHWTVAPRLCLTVLILKWVWWYSCSVHWQPCLLWLKDAWQMRTFTVCPGCVSLHQTIVSGAALCYRSTAKAFPAVMTLCQCYRLCAYASIVMILDVTSVSTWSLCVCVWGCTYGGDVMPMCSGVHALSSFVCHAKMCLIQLQVGKIHWFVKIQCCVWQLYLRLFLQCTPWHLCTNQQAENTKLTYSHHVSLAFT